MMNGVDEIRSTCLDFEIPLEWGITQKKEYLSEVLLEIRTGLKRNSLRLTSPILNPTERELVFIIIKDLKYAEKETSRKMAALSTSGSNGITDEMILSAKQYPIEDLIKVEKDFALCPFHNEKNPSFYVKNKYGHCFSCGETGDAIKIAMQVKNMTFKDAVIYLRR